MTKFIDGPASGVTLMLRRIPLPMHLRVTQNAKGEWDALDQFEDEAQPDEKLYAYEITGEQSWCHIRAAKPARSGVYAFGQFKFIAEQPSDEIMRDNSKWAHWAITRGTGKAAE